MRRNIPSTQFCLGTHTSMRMQRVASVNPTGHGLQYDVGKFGKWFEEIESVIGTAGSRLSVDTAALYQFVELFSAYCTKTNRDPRKTEIWTKIGRYPAFESDGDVNAEASAIRSGDVGGVFDGTTDLFSLYDPNATRALIMSQAATLNVVEFEGVAIHDPADHLMREAGLIDVQDGSAFYLEEKFDAEYDFQNEPQWEKIETGTIQPLLLHQSTGQIKNVGLATKHARTAVEFVKKFPGTFNYIMHTLCNPSATKGFCDLIDLAKQERESDRSLKLDMGGVLNGGMYAFTGSFEEQLAKPRVDRVVANYQNASDDQIKQAMKIDAIVTKFPGVSRIMLAAEFAGQVLETYPEICNRCVLTSMTPSRTADLIELIYTKQVPPGCWKAMLDANVFDPRCGEFLLD